MSRLLVYFCVVQISGVWGRAMHRSTNFNDKLALSRYRRQDDNNYYNNYYQQYQQQQEEQRQQYEQDMQNQYEQQNQQYEQEEQQQQYEQEQQQYEQEMQNQYEQQNQQYEQDQQNDQQQQQYEQQMNDQQQQYEQEMNNQQQDDRGGDGDRQKRSLPLRYSTRPREAVYSPSTYSLPNHASMQMAPNQEVISQPVVHFPVAIYEVNYSLCKYLLEVIISLLREGEKQNDKLNPFPVNVNDAVYTIVPADDSAHLQVNNDSEIENHVTFDDEFDMNDIS